MKICLNPGCKHNKIAQAISEFRRQNAQGRIIYGAICNTCNRIEIETLTKSLTPQPLKIPKSKPVWLVVYRSFP